jgi:hypothetical protein
LYFVLYTIRNNIFEIEYFENTCSLLANVAAVFYEGLIFIVIWISRYFSVWLSLYSSLNFPLFQYLTYIVVWISTLFQCLTFTVVWIPVISVSDCHWVWIWCYFILDFLKSAFSRTNTQKKIIFELSEFSIWFNLNFFTL